MKLTVFLIILSVLGVCASDTYSQTKKLSMKMENVKVEDVLANIEKQSEFYFFVYSEKVVDVDRKVSVDIDSQDIGKVLNSIFDGTDVAYSVLDRLIVLSTPELISNVSKMARQQHTIMGKVTDTNNEPLPGVAISVRGTTMGTISNAEGSYMLSNVPENAILVFSFVGMKNQEIAVSGKSVINVEMIEKTIGIEEVVAIGYGTMKKRDLTGSITSVKIDEELKQLPNISVVQTLHGTVAGLNVGPTNQPGEEPS